MGLFWCSSSTFQMSQCSKCFLLPFSPHAGSRKLVVSRPTHSSLLEYLSFAATATSRTAESSLPVERTLFPFPFPPSWAGKCHLQGCWAVFVQHEHTLRLRLEQFSLTLSMKARKQNRDGSGTSLGIPSTRQSLRLSCGAVASL